MSNEIIIDGIIYKLELNWRKSKKDNSVDIKGVQYPYPEKGIKWNNYEQFIDKLKSVQNILESKKRIIKCEKKDCLLCDKKNVVSKRYLLDSFVWDDSMVHYIEEHFVKPSDEFIDKIFSYLINSRLLFRINDNQKIKGNDVYIQLHKNQIMILDALMKHGGYTKKYHDSDQRNIVRYSEHAGMLDIENKNVVNIIVAGNTARVDRGDEEIFLPTSANIAYKYKYIFHTHPPTPKPGGRVEDGVLYEFPSIGDILHFVDHCDDGKTVGSIVMTPEGLYNIRKINNTKNDNINEDDMFKEYNKLMSDIQKESIKKYGTKFDTYFFYSKISQDISWIKQLNDVLGKYNICIDYYPRIKDFKGSWIVDSIYIKL